MNRLVIIGNGFDLAHELETSYAHFIKYYINKMLNECRRTHEAYHDDCFVMKRNSRAATDIDTFLDNEEVSIADFNDFLIDNAVQNWSEMSESEIQRMAYKFEQEGRNTGRAFILVCSSQFLKNLIEKASRLWVDIEADYYEELKRLMGFEGNSIAKENGLINLNRSFEAMKNEFIEYLGSIERPKIRKEITELFTEQIDFNEVPLFPERYNPSDAEHEKVENYLFVNFNYTPTINSYLIEMSKTKGYFNPMNSLVNIHGSIYEAENPIIFGFGDDFDDDFQQLEEEDLKGFRDNIKSYLYSKTENYQKVYRFIKSGHFQVFLLGHSCGLSDRTMLNMVFEDDNCKSIKIFYHGTEEENNHFELVQQLGRNFIKDKASMRLKLVSENKSRQFLN